MYIMTVFVFFFFTDGTVAKVPVPPPSTDYASVEECLRAADSFSDILKADAERYYEPEKPVKENRVWAVCLKGQAV